jgi:hypothetical protein
LADYNVIAHRCPPKLVTASKLLILAVRVGFEP